MGYQSNGPSRLKQKGCYVGLELFSTAMYCKPEDETV